MRQFIIFISICFVLTQNAFSDVDEYRYLNDLVKEKKVSIEAKAEGGLGEKNLILSIKNLFNEVLNIKIRPGTHFKSEDQGAQDLIIIEAPEFALAPSTSKSLAVQGFCTQHHNYSPSTDGLYVYNGIAEPALSELCQILYSPILRGIRQTMVWSITDRNYSGNSIFYAKDSSEIEIYKSLSNHLDKYISVKPDIAIYNPSLHGYMRTEEKIFSWKGTLSFIVPKASRVTFKTLDKNGDLKHMYFSDRLIQPGIKYYEFGINDIINQDTLPEYTAIIETSDGQKLVEVKVDGSTVLEQKATQIKKIGISLDMKTKASPAYINIYNEKGELHQVFKKYKSLGPGLFTFNLKIEHFGNSKSKFEIRIEDSELNQYYSKWTD
jgi:hypothetical protein